MHINCFKANRLCSYRMGDKAQKRGFDVGTWESSVKEVHSARLLCRLLENFLGEYKKEKELQERKIVLSKGRKIGNAQVGPSRSKQTEAFLPYFQGRCLS